MRADPPMTPWGLGGAFPVLDLGPAPTSVGWATINSTGPGVLSPRGSPQRATQLPPHGAPAGPCLGAPLGGNHQVTGRMSWLGGKGPFPEAPPRDLGTPIWVLRFIWVVPETLNPLPRNGPPAVSRPPPPGPNWGRGGQECLLPLGHPRPRAETPGRYPGGVGLGYPQYSFQYKGEWSLKPLGP